jgi:hypothetical protein
VAPAVGASQEGLIDILGRMENILRLLHPFIEVPPPRSESMKDTSEKILLVVLSIITSITEEITQGRASEFILADMPLFTHPYSEKYLKQLTRRNVVEDALQRLRKLTLVMRATSAGMAHGVISERITGSLAADVVLTSFTSRWSGNRSRCITDDWRRRKSKPFSYPVGRRR